MTGLVVLAAIVGALTHPAHGYDVGYAGDRRVVQPSAASLIAWAVVCVAMVAGLVTWAVLR